MDNDTNPLVSEVYELVKTYCSVKHGLGHTVRGMELVGSLMMVAAAIVTQGHPEDIEPFTDWAVKVFQETIVQVNEKKPTIQ